MASELPVKQLIVDSYSIVHPNGKLTEWPIVSALKAEGLKGSVGSNPTLSSMGL